MNYREEKDKFESKWNNLLQARWDLNQNDYGASFRLPENEDHLIQWREREQKGLPFIMQYEEGKTMKPKYILITDKNFKFYFYDDKCNFEQFKTEFKSLQKELKKMRNNVIAAKSSASMVMDDAYDNSKTREKIVYFFSTAQHMNKYTKADDEFIFNRIYKDTDGKMYMKLNAGLFMLETKPGTERTLLGNTLEENSQFWPEFFKTFSKQFIEWNKKITDIVNDYRWGEDEKSLETVLMENDIPRVYLECLSLRVIEKGHEVSTKNGNKTIWEFSGATIALNSNYGKNVTFSQKNLISVFSENLIQALDVTRVKKIPIFSNNPNEIAVKYLTLPQVTEDTNEPSLPPTWDLFFGGKRFVHPMMEKLKIASFIVNTLNAKYSGRQVMVLGGDGHDGKGTFLEVINHIIGSDFTAVMAPKHFSDSDEFGLQPIINKKMVYFPDCKAVSKLFATDKFKSLTGSDEMSINRKNLKIVKYKPVGVTVAIGTNNPIFINGEHGLSRVMPIFFRKNYDNKTKIDRAVLSERLLDEKDAFIQWCVNYRAYMKRQTNGQIFAGEELLQMSDAKLKRVMKGATVSSSQLELLEEMCQEYTYLSGDNFVHFNERSADEEAVYEDFKEVVVDLLRKYVGEFTDKRFTCFQFVLFLNTILEASYAISHAEDNRTNWEQYNLPDNDWKLYERFINKMKLHFGESQRGISSRSNCYKTVRDIIKDTAFEFSKSRQLVDGDYKTNTFILGDIASLGL